jgi:hypothetical protein
MIDCIEICKNIFILTVLIKVINKFPYLRKYDNDIKFSIYRSFICISLAIMGLDVFTNNFVNGFSHPFSFKNGLMSEIYQLFFAYLLVDVIYMIATKCKRIDLYGHHIMCLGALIISHFTNKFGYIHSIVLIAEILSAVSGVDNMAMNDNDMVTSLQCKKIRRNIIRYIRYPIWIILFLFTIRYSNKTPSLLWYNLLVSSIVMTKMDQFWEKKCEKIIAKYEK